MSIKKLTELSTFTQRFSYLIELIKNKNNINQSKIASEIGLSTAAMSKLIKGDSKSAAGTTLASLQSKYQANPMWLTELEGEPFLSEPRIAQEDQGIQKKNGIKIAANEHGRMITATTEGWERIFESYIDQEKFDTIDFELSKEAMKIDDPSRKIGVKLVSFLVYDKRQYDYLVFFLQSTPIQGYILANNWSGGRIIELDDSKQNFKFSIKGIFGGGWSKIPVDKNIEFIITLTWKELHQILKDAEDERPTGKHSFRKPEIPEIQRLLKSKIEGLEEDKERLIEDKEELRATITELKKEMASLEKRQTGS